MNMYNNNIRTLNNIDHLTINNMEKIINPIYKSPYIARPKNKTTVIGDDKIKEAALNNPQKGKVFIAYPKSKIHAPVSELTFTGLGNEVKEALFIAYPKKQVSMPGAESIVKNNLNAFKDAYIAVPPKNQSRFDRLYINTKSALDRRRACISNLLQTLKLKVS